MLLQVRSLEMSCGLGRWFDDRCGLQIPRLLFPLKYLARYVLLKNLQITNAVDTEQMPRHNTVDTLLLISASLLPESERIRFQFSLRSCYQALIC